MKKLILLSTFALLVHFSAQAQFTRYGAQMGAGVAYVTDDLLLSAPIMGFQLGGYVDYEFTNWKNPWAENLYLRFGLNFTRRGTKLEQVWVLQKSIRQSFIHNWYAQIPVIVGFRYEIPSLPAGNYVNFFFGPEFNVGLFGRYWDRQVTPGYPQADVNYDTDRSPNKKDSHIYKHIRRWDVSLLCGATYRRNNLTVNLYYDHGFAPLLYQEDALISSTTSATTQSGNDTSKGGTSTSDPSTGFADATTRNAFTGTHQALILSLA